MRQIDGDDIEGGQSPNNALIPFPESKKEGGIQNFKGQNQ